MQQQDLSLPKIVSPALWLLIPLIGFPQMSETIYSPALPNIASWMHVAHAYVQWTLSIYFIGFAIGVFALGRLSDHIGRRRAMLLGLCIYIVGSVLCMSAQNITWLLLARLLQGLGASCGSVIIQAIARESMGDHKRHQFYSMSGFVMAFSITVGPFLGGYLTQWFHWQSNFVLLVGIGLALLILATWKLPETLQKSHSPTPSVGSVLKQMLKDKQLIGCAILVAICNGILFSYYAEGPFVFIKLIGLTPSEFGRLGLFIALASLCGSLASRKLVHHVSKQAMLNIGCTIMIVSSVILTIVAFTGVINSSHTILASILILVPMMGLVLASFGFIMPLTLSSALANYHSIVGTAGAIFGLSYYLLISLVTWGMGYLNNGTALPMPLYFLGLSVLSAVVINTLIKSKSTKVKIGE